MNENLQRCHGKDIETISHISKFDTKIEVCCHSHKKNEAQWIWAAAKEDMMRKSDKNEIRMSENPWKMQEGGGGWHTFSLKGVNFENIHYPPLKKKKKLGTLDLRCWGERNKENKWEKTKKHEWEPVEVTWRRYWDDITYCQNLTAKANCATIHPTKNEAHQICYACREEMITRSD